MAEPQSKRRRVNTLVRKIGILNDPFAAKAAFPCWKQNVGSSALSMVRHRKKALLF